MGAAVRADGGALEFVSEELRMDADLALLAKIVSERTKASLDVGSLVGSDDRVRAVFQAVGNHSGKITEPQFAEAVRKLLPSILESDIQALFSKVDANSDGIVDETEFTTWLFHAEGIDEDSEFDEDAE